MGLSVTVGILAELAEDDSDLIDHYRAEFDAINTALREHGLPEHTEPTVLAHVDDRSGVGGFPYSFLHYLRRFYARWIDQLEQDQKPFRRFFMRATSRADWKPAPVIEGEAISNDPIVEKIASRKHHLLWHSDCEGYYVPVQFPEVIEDERILGLGVGSSMCLLKELTLIAGPLGILLDEDKLKDEDAKAISEEGESGGLYWIERLVWLVLFEAARLSIEHRAAIHFG